MDEDEVDGAPADVALQVPQRLQLRAVPGGTADDELDRYGRPGELLVHGPFRELPVVGADDEHQPAQPRHGRRV